ncbi:hypothetical protein ABQJ54_04420 [Rhodanobacter sp. Si-c]|uniref:Uncharacterized protein n=1 Tax=Rhodanobacter lycopersici TaxID=3162487 RepID=A0ABV3QBE1_9GAMM
MPEQLVAGSVAKYPGNRLAGVGYMGYNTRPPRPKMVKEYGENHAQFDHRQGFERENAGPVA